ncbi:FAD-binding and (Fe-S)-binding domain-containing protein [soil metagenome]
MSAPDQIHAFEAALSRRLEGSIRSDKLMRAIYATDASMYRIEPLAVVVPKSDADVQAVLEESARFGLPVLPRGSGSSLAGSAIGPAVVLDFTRHMDAILSIDPEARTAVVQPGVILDTLNAELEQHGLQFGPDPASSNRATLGGMMGTNSTGTHSIRFGSVVDHVREAVAFLAGGDQITFGALDEAGWKMKQGLPGKEGDIYRNVQALLERHDEAIRRDTPLHWRRAGGYRLERLIDAPEIDRGPGRPADGTRNLAHLLCGSEGSLAITTQITLDLVEKPAHAGIAVVHYDTMRSSLEAVGTILETGPAAVELFDRMALHRARSVTEYAPRLHFVQGDPACLLFVEYDGASAEEVRAGIERLRRVIGPHAVITEAIEAAAMDDVKAVRKVGLGLVQSARLPIQALPVIEDAAVPIEHLPDYVSRLEEAIHGNGLDVVVYAHASAGCLHIRPFVDTRNGDQVAAMERVARRSAELVREYGGSLASEHGDGIARGALAREFYGDDLYAAFEDCKRAFDPRNLLNPGKIVGSPPLTSNLRVPPGTPTPSLRSRLTFPDATGTDRSFVGVVEACNGMAVCRKLDAGTMCPSFMATRAEQDSTRGRANALREALLGRIELHGPEVREALDLCISCKACKAECPAQVDMGALKTAWLAHRWQTERPDARTRLFAGLPGVSKRVAGRMAGFANRMAGTKLGKGRMTALGVAPERTMPLFATNPFTEREHAQPGQPQVVLFADTFARFHEPEIPRAALKVFEAAGVAVSVPEYRCCGRTYLSKGMVDVARKELGALLATLGPPAQRGIPIVGLEPSCILTLRDELVALFPGDDRARALADMACTFEEWAMEAKIGGRFDDAQWRTDGPAEALVHTHCHQRALSTTSAGMSCASMTGATVTESGAGCCGMAGSFGYEAEHYAVSVAMAEDRLAPAVRATSEATEIVAAGTSCRAQIKHTTGRTARHPAVVLAEALEIPTAVLTAPPA